MSGVTSASQVSAPEARLVDVDDGSVMSDGGTHLISVKVTQVNSGISQLSFVLNNQRQAASAPRFPPWAYNGMKRFGFGKQVRLDMGYSADSDWTAMILARITDLQFSFPSSGGATLNVQAQDLLSLLDCQDPKEKDKPYKDQAELDIVKDCVSRAGASSSLPIGKSLVPPLELGQPLYAETHQRSQSFLQFLLQLTQRLDYELFVDFDNRMVNKDPDKASAANPELHFEPARSLKKDTVVKLTWGADIVELTPRFKVWDQYTSVTAKGRDPRRREAVLETADENAVKEDLQAGSSSAPLSAVALRRKFFAQQPDNPFSLQVSSLDRQRAAANAKAVLRARARELLTIDGSTIGRPAIRPGIHIEIDGMSAPFDGLYYVTRAVHSLDQSGYRTAFSLRRPGMLDPALYESAEKNAGSNG